MYCGCQGKRAIKNKHGETTDSPLQIRLIKMLGLQSYILQKFVFRRKPSTYDIRNIKGKNTIILAGEIYNPPFSYREEVEIIEIDNHSIPVIRLTPIKPKQHFLPCIIYAHGNSSDLGDSLRFITAMADKFVAEYIIFDYTGYGESRKSNVGEQIICKDLECVLSWANKPLQSVILWGFSLGSFPVVINAAKYGIKAVILQCPIGSLACMFYEEYDSEIKFKQDHFANIDYIFKIKGRVMIMHSVADEIIPIQQARLLYKKFTAKNGDKNIDFIEVEKIKHNSFHKYIIAQVSNDLQQEVLDFLSKVSSEIQAAEEKVPLNTALNIISSSIEKVKFEEDFQEREHELTEEIQASKNETRQIKSNPDWFCYRK